MNQDSAVFIVVPAFNEAASIGATLNQLSTTGHQIVVVDDGSTDATPSILSRFTQIHRLRHPINLGQGAALQTGMTYALEQGAGYIVHFDADGQHRAADIERLLEPLFADEADAVLGSRFLVAEHRQRVPPMRRCVLQAARVVNYLLSGLWLTDAHNGLRALARRAAEAVHFQENGYGHATEILIQLARAKLRVVERPACILYTDYARAKGQSTFNAVHILLDLCLGRLLR